ncbi:MAG: DUF2017 domain-containing protein [Nocardioidaceae bacterium]
MSHFKSRRKGRVLVDLPPYAAGLLANLTRQLIELLSDGEPMTHPGADPLEAMLELDSPRDEPEDPALLRLLPNARPDDDEAAAEFRRFTERNLRESKIRDARSMLKSLGDIGDVGESDLEFELDAEHVRSWLRCLTDLRLTLAERLGVTADDDARWESLPPDDERLPIHEIYGWLGYLLESLLDAVQR